MTQPVLRRFQRYILHSVTIVLFSALLTACGSDDDPNEVVDTDLVPEDIQSTAAFDSVGVASKVDVSLEGPDGERLNYHLHGITPGSVSPELVLYRRLEDADNNGYLRFATYDLTSSTLTPVFETQPGQSGEYLSQDASAIAYIDLTSCHAWFQTLETSAQPVLINPLLPEYSCPRPPLLTAYGDVMVFSMAVGAYDANDVLRFDSWDSQRFDVAIYQSDVNEAVDLTAVGLPTDDTELGSLQRNLMFQAGSFDGRWLVFRAAFLPPPSDTSNPASYVVGTWIYNTGTGESRLLNRNAYAKTISDRVPLGGEDDATISGDGNIIWYIETDGVSEYGNNAPSVLKRLDLVSGQTTTVNVSGYKQALFSSDDGRRVVFMLDGELVVYRHDTGTLLHTRQALNFCSDVDIASGCEFDGYRYVLNEPGTISGDGSSVLLQTIPERSDVTEPQNIMELMLLDVDTGLLRRVAPGHDVLWTAISYAGDTVAYMDGQGDDGTYLAEERLMVIQR